MSSVFLAENAAGEQFALKLLNLSLEAEPEFRKRFQREAELTHKLSHPNIVKTLSWADDPEAGVYLLMEFVPGGNLRQALQDGSPLELSRVVELLGPVASALDYAHEQGVVHRDIKPENLLFTDSGTLKIADFGVARVLEGTRLTRTGVLPGTPEYMAPELFSAEPAGPASDLYSLATIAYEALTGSTPFHSENLAQVLQRQAFEEPEPPSHRRPELPAYLDRVFLRALDKHPERRPESVSEFVRALAEPPSGSRTLAGVHSAPTRQVQWKRTPTERPRFPWGLALAVWIAAACLWLFRLYPPPEPPGWVDTGLGWQPAPLGRQLCASVLWSGIEVVLVHPEQKSPSLSRARFLAALLDSWLRREPPDEDTFRGKKDGEFYVLEGRGELLRIDAQMAVNLGATPEQIGEYWLALMKDISRIRSGQSPRVLEELERDRPVRLDRTGPRYPLLDRLYERCRIRQREGAIPTPVIVDALESLGWQDWRTLREAARSVPLPKP